MRRTRILASLVASVLLLFALPATVSAQDDLSGIVPYIMLVVDTSGSMERQAECSCTTPACVECLPRCNLPNDPISFRPPPEKINRWAVTLEALTGEFNNFACDPIERTEGNLGADAYDLDYTFPYHQPWACSTSGTPCPYNALANPPLQKSDGILDLNISGIRFGLMTFDGIATYGRDTQLTEAQFDEPTSNDIDGLWSYGGKKPYRYPNCENVYFMDTGARSNIATEGALISLESCSGPGPLGTPGCESWCTACPGTMDTVNKDIQESLLATRPFGSTPIAAALDDLYYHFKEDLSDQFQQCRDRYAILITDGRPDDDYRNVGCDCFEDNDPSDCGGPPNDPSQMKCPYPLPERVAQDLVEGRGTDGAAILRLYVLGLAIDDPITEERIEKIADAGCTGTPAECEIGTTGKQSILADNLDTLRSAVQVIVEASNKPVSRTVPVFASSGVPDEPQYMFNTALRLPTQSNQPWHGVLERRRFVCGESDTDESGFEDLDDAEGDLFHENLDQQSSAGQRRILTALPSTFNRSILEGVLNDDSGFCAGTACEPRELDALSVADRRRAFEAVDDPEAEAITDWIYAKDGTAREGAALGAIYHSTPAIWSPPRFDTVDINYNLFRRFPYVGQGPQLLYVGTTDGLLHAISTGEYDSASIDGPGDEPWRDLKPGEELWSFIPPMLLDNMRTNLTSQQFLMDSPPVVKTVNLDADDPDENKYRNLLVMGMRGGGNAYIGLDVTDPFDPQFIWQFTDPALGRTYGQPAIVQARFQREGAIKNGAVVILPGGVGQLAAGDPSCDGGTTESMRNGSAPFRTLITDPNTGAAADTPAVHRSDVRCWTPMGRALYFLDAEDGFLLKAIHREDPSQQPPFSPGNQPVFPSPLVSAPAVFPDEVGVPASRAFITDADGVIWRIDMRDPDVQPDEPLLGWTARPFHDVFWGLDPTSGELSYEPPLLSVDEQGRPVVIVGTGDTGNFNKPAIANRVVSLTEIETTVDEDEPEHFQAQMNWELRTKTGTITTAFTDSTTAVVDGLATSELVTGPMGLFEGELYIGTFISVANGENVCDLGRGRIFALDYLAADPDDENGSSGGGTVTTYGPRRINAADPDDDESIINILRSDTAGDNVKVAGISLVQVPSCAETTAAYSDPWSPSYGGVSSSAPSQMKMMAHADDDRNTESSTVNQSSGSQISTVEKGVRPPTRHTRIISWAATVD
jgi:type IV pilus assembly protein PilY1